MYFDHEKLTVYKTSIGFVAFAAGLLDKVKGQSGAVRDQLLRSSQSIALNIAEGNGKRSPADRRRFFEIARGSAMESAATLDVLVAIGSCTAVDIEPGKALPFPIVKMLSKMTDGSSGLAREERDAYSSDVYFVEEQEEQEQD
jgi:four helix bundle protein